MPRARPRQLDLALTTWGGARPGAGRRPRGLHPGVPHAPRPALAARFPVHVTLRVRPHVFQLRSRRAFRVVGAALLAARTRLGMRVCHYSVQGNHLHLLVEARDATALSRGMKGLAVRLARGLNRLIGTRGPVLADRYHARILRTPREVRSALAYVLGNHRHHAASWPRAAPGLGRPAAPAGPAGAWQDGGIDPYTSGRAFDGWRRGGRGARPGTRAGPGRRGDTGPGRRGGTGPGRRGGTGPPPVPVAAPRTWLLATGWRRHGLLPAP